MKNPLSGVEFFVDPNSSAVRDGDPRLAPIVNRSRAYWFAGQYGKPKVQERIRRQIKRHGDFTPVLVLYNLPLRDLGGHSKGGCKTPKEYFEFVEEFALGIGDSSPIVIVEPDALANCQNLSVPGKLSYIRMLWKATARLKETNAFVYLDAGNPEFIVDPKLAAELLLACGIRDLDGFSLNVSNFYATEVCEDYAEKINNFLGERSRFVIDTSRNGVGNISKEDWCNPPGRRLGNAPTTHTRHPDCDAYLWIKPPGESDGEENGGPRPGVFWKEYALELCGYGNSID
jgi:endoglucanase